MPDPLIPVKGRNEPREKSRPCSLNRASFAVQTIPLTPGDAGTSQALRQGLRAALAGRASPSQGNPEYPRPRVTQQLPNPLG